MCATRGRCESRRFSRTLRWNASPHVNGEAVNDYKDASTPYGPREAQPARVETIGRRQSPPDVAQAATALVSTGIFLVASSFDIVISSMPSLSVAFTPSALILAGRSNTRKIRLACRSQ